MLAWQELTTRATLKINPEHNTIQDPDTVAISGSFEMTWTVDVAKVHAALPPLPHADSL